MSYYIFGPTDKANFVNVNLKECIKLIGIQQVGKGSLDAKGRRYIKSVANCSNRSIKRLYSSHINLIVQHDHLGTYAFIFHSEKTASIIKVIVDYINKNLSKRQQNMLENYFKLGKINVNTIFYDQRLCLQYIESTDYRGYGNKAEDILIQLNNI